MPEPTEVMVEAASRVLYDWLYEHPDWTGEDILGGDLARSVLAAVSPGCRGAELAEALKHVRRLLNPEPPMPRPRDPARDRATEVIDEALAAFRASGEAGPDPLTERVKELERLLDDSEGALATIAQHATGIYVREIATEQRDALREALSGGVVG